MPPIYLGDTPVTVYKGEAQVSCIRIGEAIIECYATITTSTTTTPEPTTTTTPEPTTTTPEPTTTTPAPAALSLVLSSPLSRIDGVNRLVYGDIPLGTTQLRVTLTVTGGVSPLPSEITKLFDINTGVIAVYQGDYVFAHGLSMSFPTTPGDNPYIAAGHRDFQVTGTVQLDALDSSNNVLGTATYSGTLSSDDDD